MRLEGIGFGEVGSINRNRWKNIKKGLNPIKIGIANFGIESNSLAFFNSVLIPYLVFRFPISNKFS